MQSSRFLPSTIENLLRHLPCILATVGVLFVDGLSTIRAHGAERPRSSSPPNIMLVLADDLGYGDLACYGNSIVKTPHLDRFARQGLRFTHCYSAGANCSPSRAGLMTGRTPYRVGIHNQIPFLSPMHLRSSEKTIAALLRDFGYDTCHVGKWHLNGMFNLPGQPRPADHGFRHSFGTQNNCLPNHRNPYNFVRNDIPVGPLEGYAAQLVVDEAERWLRTDRDPTKPFFLYVAFHEPHEPIRSAPEFETLYDFPDDPSRTAYFANISQMDHAFGRLAALLEELNVAEETLVWFTSDNGPARTKWHNAGSTAGLRDYKGSVAEGGIRVPGLVRWPGRVAAGAVSDVPVCGVDFLPTACAAAGVAPPHDRTLDGTSLLPLFGGQAFHRRRPLYWQFNDASGDHALALRDGDWKIVARLSLAKPRQRASITAEGNHVLQEAEPVGFEIYNLAADPAEQRDLTAAEPARAATLRKQLIDAFHEVRAETPVWPTFDDPGYEAPRIEWPTYVAKPLAPPKQPAKARD